MTTRRTMTTSTRLRPSGEARDGFVRAGCCARVVRSSPLQGPEVSDMAVTKFGIGQPARRVEDARLITGGGRYGDDYAPEGCLHAVLLRSPHAHARFRITDLEAARAMPGVHLVLTAEDVAHLGEIRCQAPLPNDDGTQGHLAHIPVLANGVVKHVGDAVAFVVADTAAQGRDAVE